MVFRKLAIALSGIDAQANIKCPLRRGYASLKLVRAALGVLGVRDLGEEDNRTIEAIPSMLLAALPRHAYRYVLSGLAPVRRCG